VKTYAVALENIIVKRATPVIPKPTVMSPKEAAVVVAASDRIPFVATAMVTRLPPAVLSMYNSVIVPRDALRAAPNKVPVGRVIVVAATEVEVM